MIVLKSNKYFFCLKKLSYIRSTQEPKLCTKLKLSFLNKQVTPSSKYAGNLMFNGQFKFMYFKLLKSYALFLKSFLNKSLSIYSLFYFSLLKDKQLFNLDYALVFWLKPLQSLFRSERTKVYNIGKFWMRYVKPSRRNLLILRWISLLYRCYMINYKNFFISFFNLWNELFVKPLKLNKLNKIKLHIYRIYLYKLY